MRERPGNRQTIAPAIRTISRCQLLKAGRRPRAARTRVVVGVLRTFAAPVQDEVGYALFLAQRGEKHESAKPLKGFGAGVLEIVSDHRGDTFRAVYTVGDRGQHATESDCCSQS